jgi:hypothetical protein
MEWQSNAVAPRILMPRAQTEIKVKRLLKERGYIERTPDSLQVIHDVIDELSEFYRVSKQAAKIRLINFGYHEAAEVYNYETPDCLCPSKEATMIDVFSEYQNNKDFRFLFDEELFRNVEGRYVINADKYRTLNADGDYVLTEYAKENLDECAITFEYNILEIFEYNRTSGVMYKRAREACPTKIFYPEHNEARKSFCRYLVPTRWSRQSTGKRRLMRAETSDNEIRLTESYLYRESIKKIAGRRYDADAKAWFIPRTERNIAFVRLFGAELDDNLKTAARKIPRATIAETDETPICEMPLKIKPYRHQIRGFNACMSNAGYGLLFEVGLGKSATAIAAFSAVKLEKTAVADVKRFLSKLSHKELIDGYLNRIDAEAKILILQSFKSDGKAAAIDATETPTGEMNILTNATETLIYGTEILTNAMETLDTAEPSENVIIDEAAVGTDANGTFPPINFRVKRYTLQA